MRFRVWSAMTAVIPEGEHLERVMQRLRDGLCLICDAHPNPYRRGLCPKCERKFRLAKMKIPSRMRRAWEDQLIREGKVLDKGLASKLLNPFVAIGG